MCEMSGLGRSAFKRTGLRPSFSVGFILFYCQLPICLSSTDSPRTCLCFAWLQYEHSSTQGPPRRLESKGLPWTNMTTEIQRAWRQNGPNRDTQRGLSSRQLQLIAIGGCVGTGLFVGSSDSLNGRSWRESGGS
jgi:hypothetical protein